MTRFSPVPGPKTYWAMVSALLLLAACGEDRVTESVATDNDTENAASELIGNESATAPAAADFAAAVAANDLYEIQSGELGADKAASAEVKSFAQMLVADHKKSTADLKAAMANAGPPMSADPVLDQEKLAMIDELKEAPAGRFDKAFIDQQKQAHQKALELLRGYQASGDNEALKDFAAKASPVVQAHLDKLNGMRP